MKAKSTVPRKGKLPKGPFRLQDLPRGPNSPQGISRARNYDEDLDCLAEVRLRNAGWPDGICGAMAHIDAINWLHGRAAALCFVVGQSAFGECALEDSLTMVMTILEEDIKVAGKIANNLHDLRRKPTDPKAGPSA